MRKILPFVLAALLGNIRADEDYPDPEGFSHNGRFFYAQINYQQGDSIHYYTNVGLGCNNFSQKWIISTQEESVGYATSVCKAGGQTRCTVPDRFPWGDDIENPSDACITDFSASMIEETAHLNDGADGSFIDPIPEYILQGFSATNRIMFYNSDYGRQMEVDMKSFAIMQSNNFEFQSNTFSGYLGLGPYSSDSQIKDENIIYHLKKNGVIDHAIFSLYLLKNGRSSIKFGGYDRDALYDYKDFNVFKTVDRHSWKIPAANFKLYNIAYLAKDENVGEFLVDPQLSAIYMPSDHYDEFKKRMPLSLSSLADCT